MRAAFQNIFVRCRAVRNFRGARQAAYGPIRRAALPTNLRSCYASPKISSSQPSIRGGEHRRDESLPSPPPLCCSVSSSPYSPTPHCSITVVNSALLIVLVNCSCLLHNIDGRFDDLPFAIQYHTSSQQTHCGYFSPPNPKSGRLSPAGAHPNLDISITSGHSSI